MPDNFELPNTDTSTYTDNYVKINAAAVTELVSGCLYDLYITKTSNSGVFYHELGSVTDSSPREVQFAWPSDHDLGDASMNVKVQIWHPDEPTKIDQSSSFVMTNYNCGIRFRDIVEPGMNINGAIVEPIPTFALNSVAKV